MSTVKYAAKFKDDSFLYLYDTKAEREVDWNIDDTDVIFTTIRTTESKLKKNKKKQVGRDFNWAVEQMTYGHAVTRLDWVSNRNFSIKLDSLGFVIENDETKDAYELSKHDFQSKKWVLA
jgi:hypothetical protein